MRNAMIINEKDNVIVAIEPIAEGSEAVYMFKGEYHKLPVAEDIPMYHKLARTDIAQGEQVIKYGEYIGEAGCAIAAGSHVHTHNVLSVRERVTD